MHIATFTLKLDQPRNQFSPFSPGRIMFLGDTDAFDYKPCLVNQTMVVWRLKDQPWKSLVAVITIICLAIADVLDDKNIQLFIYSWWVQLIEVFV